MIIHSVNSFIRNASGYLREAKSAEVGHTQAIRARYARKFFDELKITYSGPTREEIESRGACIYVANHTSMLDAVIVCCFFEGDLRILAKESLFKVPWLGRILRLEKHIMVARGKNAPARNASIRESIKTAISEGASVFFFPEGTRSMTGKLGKFHCGAFYNAIETGVPIVPVVIRGALERLPKHSLRVRPGHISIELLPSIPVPEESMGDLSTRAKYLSDQASEAISKELDKN
ncbi:MAG: 1-acyl-sn-glycerol-3-phosphate acyltransferase [Proteobacteria bacterium]|nr:1-acyl-sn-glycerol-3-phosphate acyltransferase [Pseudomonadota bacterium]